jgi:hypothetical protein
MNRDETLVEKYLKSLNMGPVIYEPDRKVPPDFLVDGHIAVECRRLNKHYLQDRRPRGLEEDSIPLLQSVERLLGEFGPADDGQSWFVMLRVKRPISPWQHLRRRLKLALQEVIANPEVSIVDVPIEEGFTVRLAPASPGNNWTFAIGAFADIDQGGWVVADVVSNLTVYVDDKSKKVRAYRDRYSVWWLIFIDYIGYARDGVDIRRHFQRPSEWERLVLLSPVDGTAYDI